MIEGKEAGVARKRRARDKANLRLIKNQHLILPGLLLAALMGALAGGTLANSMAPGLIVYGAFVGGGVALIFGGPSVVRALCR